MEGERRGAVARAASTIAKHDTRREGRGRTRRARRQVRGAHVVVVDVDTDRPVVSKVRRLAHSPGASRQQPCLGR